MILSHYSWNIFKFDSLKIYNNNNICLKPDGLWLSTNNKYGWRYIHIKSYYNLNFGYETKFKIDTSNIIILDSYEKIEEFTLKYGVKYTHEFKEFNINTIFDNTMHIDWNLVSKEYDGILCLVWDEKSSNIPTKYMWYSSLDCISCCIWNLKCVTQIRPTILQKLKI